ncbi:hypothetical protein GCM10010349_17580 [Streptomyces flavofungini]|nr:hypothetical protein GCM10010349_17580 [Streptomyces flavofungini]
MRLLPRIPLCGGAGEDVAERMGRSLLGGCVGAPFTRGARQRGRRAGQTPFTGIQLRGILEGEAGSAPIP